MKFQRKNCKHYWTIYVDAFGNEYWACKNCKISKAEYNINRKIWKKDLMLKSTERATKILSSSYFVPKNIMDYVFVGQYLGKNIFIKKSLLKKLYSIENINKTVKEVKNLLKI